MSFPIRVVQYGLGPIGLATARTVLEKENTGRLELVGAIDIAPEKVGRDVGELAGRSEKAGVVVSDASEVVLAETVPDVVLHATTSFLDGMSEQLIECAEAGAHVVSSTEELAFPFERHPRISEELDAAAKAHDVVMVGTGVNPGYAMDTLALTATGVCTEVTRLQIERIVDASERRLPLQRKIGAGITREAFLEKKKTGTFGHIGLRESLLMVAEGLGWPLERTEETLDPVISGRRVETPHLAVEKGEVGGLHHAISGWVDGEERLSLDLKMYVGAEKQYDAVRVEGTPPIHLVAEDGIFGDTATVAALVNTVPLVLEARPGLRTMKDLSVPRAFATSLSALSEPAADVV